MIVYSTNIVDQFKLYNKGEEFTIGSLGLERAYANVFYRFIKSHRPDGDVELLNYNDIIAINGVGETKARAIVNALEKHGVRVYNIPAVKKKRNPIRFVPSDDPLYKICTNCGERIHEIVKPESFNYCPYCGKKLTKEY